MDDMYILAIQLGLALLAALSVYFFLVKNLSKLLDEVIKLPAGTTFYSRLLGLLLVLIALASALDKHTNFGSNAAFMEYVWHFGDVLSSIFAGMVWFLSGYLLIVTILVASLRRRNE